MQKKKIFLSSPTMHGEERKFVEEAFDGSLPAFLAAFTARKALTPDEVAQLRRLVAEYEEEA